MRSSRPSNPRLLYRAFVRLVIVLLVALLVLLVYLARSPAVLQHLIAGMPGFVEVPVLGPLPRLPQIDVPRGTLPVVPVGLSGSFGAVRFSCGFLLELEDGRRIGVSTAHAALPLPAGSLAEFRDVNRELVAVLDGQLRRGRPSHRGDLRMDYVIWSVAEVLAPDYVLRLDPRGQAEPGERVVVYDPFGGGAGGGNSWPGVVARVAPEATWLQMDDSFAPYGFSGCPVISQHTGLVVGMVIAGKDLSPVVLGLHPASSLVEKANAAFALP